MIIQLNERIDTLVARNVLVDQENTALVALVNDSYSMILQLNEQNDALIDRINVLYDDPGPKGDAGPQG